MSTRAIDDNIDHPECCLLPEAIVGREHSTTPSITWSPEATFVRVLTVLTSVEPTIGHRGQEQPRDQLTIRHTTSRHITNQATRHKRQTRPQSPLTLGRPSSRLIE